MDATRESFFKPEKLSATDKANRTDSAARQILDAETRAREKKTEALRALRLAQERALAAEPPKEKPARKTKSRARG